MTAGDHRTMTPGASSWRAIAAELTIAGAAVAATAIAAYAWAGAKAAVIVITGAGVVALVMLRSLVAPYLMPARPYQELASTGRSVITSFWRKRGLLRDATSASGRYDYELRPLLQHLLAARLSERHDISLYAEPERARELLAGGKHDDLWQWLDPARQAQPLGKDGGIPVRTLAAIIDRLEQL
jgi:hypothetical protein